MEEFILEAVVRDLGPRLTGATLGRIWQPSESTLVLDFRQPDGRFLVVSANPSAPALFLTTRSHRDIEQPDSPHRAMAAALRKHVAGARLEVLKKDRGDRIVHFTFLAFDAGGARTRPTLAVALTGRSANAYLVDETGRVVCALRQRPTTTEGSQDERYSIPAPDVRPAFDSSEARELAERSTSAREFGRAVSGLGPTLIAELEARAVARGSVQAGLDSLVFDLAYAGSSALLYERSGRPPKFVLSTVPLESMGAAPAESFDDVSAAAAAQAERVAAMRALDVARRAVSSAARSGLEKRERLAAALRDDVERAEGADRLRELGELLLAQVGTARPAEGGFLVEDYYGDSNALVLAPASEGDSPQAAARRLFSRYQKARRAAELARTRLDVALAEADELGRLAAEAEAADTSAEISQVEREVARFTGTREAAPSKAGARGRGDAVRGARRFVSSDGFEILVGRTSAANDALTFKVAKPSDTWLHAADYPGSHVVVRNPGRVPLPHRTLVEAAQLAAFYSQAHRDGLVDVRYTERRHVTKPRGAAPGLVRLTRFRTILVAPSARLQG